MLALLREMVSPLLDTYRQVIELRVYEGFSTRQMADLLHVSARTSRPGCIGPPSCSSGASVAGVSSTPMHAKAKPWL